MIDQPVNAPHAADLRHFCAGNRWILGPKSGGFAAAIGRIRPRKIRRKIRKPPEIGDTHRCATAERVIAELHPAGGVDIPREFVIMDRAAIGLSAVFLRLQAKVNWHRLFEELIAGFDPTALARRQTEALTRHEVPLPS